MRLPEGAAVIRIFIADDHALVREGIRGVFVKQPDFSVVGDAGDYSEAVERLRQIPVDVVIVDITMPGRDGFELISYIQTAYPRMRIIALTMHVADEYVSRALKAGAHGYVTKDAAPDQLVAAVRRVMTGSSYLSARVAESMALRLTRHETSVLPHTRLSRREYAIFSMLVEGSTVTAIAKELGVSVKTVSTHKMRLLRKMHLRNQSDLVRYALQNQVSKP
jgi:DNA-binding NarL/FixJ family response regulator